MEKHYQFNSSWEMHRIGLIDFWYYDHEEFYFGDGRLLLRGANGSGKSVTMQSFIPLLLDGNMRPERLDPFGSKARKIENYLLEEGDTREERTGYLYLEFKRKDSETYVTIGMGIRGRKNKGVNVWYFYLGDGRRVGKDFFLYKELKEKICLTRKELENRIGFAGKVVDRQKEYMELVNRKIFGFENSSSYIELINLLIQLRTPKLSKDFKPTVINEILESSLQTLSDEDFRPLSEAIENMETYEINLSQLRKSEKAIKNINEIYDRYNRRILYDRAQEYQASLVQQKSLDSEMKEGLEAQKEKEAIQKSLEKDVEALRLEEITIKHKIEDLGQNDAVELMKKVNTQKEALREEKKSLTIKEEKLREKKEKQRSLESNLEDGEDEVYGHEKKLKELLEEMGDFLSELHFNEHTFMKSELLEKGHQPYSFDFLEIELDKIRAQIDEGREILFKIRGYEELRNAAFVRLDTAKSRRSKIENNITLAEDQLDAIKNETIEKIFYWRGKNQEFRVEDKNINQISGWIEAFNGVETIKKITTLVFDVFKELSKGITAEFLKLKSSLDQLEDTRKEKEEILKEWIEKKDPEPLRSSAVLENRKHLRALGIPFKPFYKFLDFGADLRADEKNNLEELLAEMGILDALVVPKSHQSLALKNDTGTLDRYIFTEHLEEKNLNEVLTIDSEAIDLIFSGEINTILKGIGCGDILENTKETWINPKGTYGLGILKGNISRTYEAKYIGEKQRKRYQEEIIKKMTEELEILADEILEVNNKMALCDHRLKKLELEKDEFPTLEDVDSGFDQCVELEKDLKNAMDEVLREEKVEKALYDKIGEAQEKIMPILEKTGLKSSLDLFTEAKVSMEAYQKKLNELRLTHGRLLNVLEMQKSSKDQIESLEQDLEDLRYDTGTLERKIQILEKKIEAGERQLKDLDYESIQREYEICLNREKEIPKEFFNLAKEIQKTVDQISSICEKIAENKIKLKEENKRRIIFEEGFIKEVSLNYCDFEVNKDMDSERFAQKVMRNLKEVKPLKNKEGLVESLQEKIYSEKGNLTEYNIGITWINEADDPPFDFRRMDLLANYRGKKVKFKELQNQLSIELEEQNLLLKEEEQHLFEDIMADTVSKKIRGRIINSQKWVKDMNQLMGKTKNTGGFELSLVWKSKGINDEKQLDTKELIRLLERDAALMKEEDREKLVNHFRSKITEAKQLQSDTSNTLHAAIKEVLDYRKWFEFQLYYQKANENRKELTNNAFFRLSGGEKALSMYVPLFSAVVAKYQGCREDAPKLISLDEAFAGIDENNIRNMFALMVDFGFNFIINSQILWGDYDTVPKLAVYQLIRPENAKFVTVEAYLWNGISKEICFGEVDFNGKKS